MGRNTKPKVGNSDKTKIGGKTAQNETKLASKWKASAVGLQEQLSLVETNNNRKTRKIEPKQLSLKGKEIDTGDKSAKNNNAVPAKSPSRAVRSTRNETKQKGTGERSERSVQDDEMLDETPNENDHEFEVDGIRVMVNASEDEFGDESDFTDYENEEDEPAQKEDQPSTSGLNAAVSQENAADEEVNDEERAMQFLAANPGVGKVFKKWIKEGIAEEAAKNKDKKTGELSRNHGLRAVKSPSDTTIYAPALNKIQPLDGGANEAIVKISNFVDEMRIASNASTPSRNAMPEVPERQSVERADEVEDDVDDEIQLQPEKQF